MLQVIYAADCSITQTAYCIDYIFVQIETIGDVILLDRYQLSNFNNFPDHGIYFFKASYVNRFEKP